MPALFYRITEGMRITARPRFLPEQSRPEVGHFVFTYSIRLENVSDQVAQLVTRHWRIHDEVGEQSEVRGDGVVGEQPSIPAGGTYEYHSFCVLKSPQGWMEGSYHFVRPDGTEFDAAIPRFMLDADAEPPPG
jgi:ApaG protein